MTGDVIVVCSRTNAAVQQNPVSGAPDDDGLVRRQALFRRPIRDIARAVPTGSTTVPTLALLAVRPDEEHRVD